MLEIMLAIEVAPEFGTRVSDAAVSMLKDTLATIIDQNRRELINSSVGGDGNGNGT